MTKSTESSETRIIKKYANRRLYDTQTGSHLTLSDIRHLVAEDAQFQIVDAKTGEDLTRSVLLQIIKEAESEGNPILSDDSLRAIIRFYGPLQSMMGGYLEKSIQSMMEIHTQANAQSSKAWETFLHNQIPAMQNVMNQYMEQAKQLYLSSQNMFGLFSGTPNADAPKETSTTKGSDTGNEK
ncbi:hypothetical protein CUZ56_00830 [Saezia sanguinis]|uniref:Polyhydroxyalkanoate synthesis repressor PhaR n=1 Tax=Saezia sanguinis TaxID=1965230 RepID=A0A433SI35_9BURK|nr:polyhydroxyalkanoate synthesis repressor PhaR [Saezia sanguinis]RUS68340.1 hypothetical protein CUZ56_00830 [Saezia sanguinis]